MKLVLGHYFLKTRRLVKKIYENQQILFQTPQSQQERQNHRAQARPKPFQRQRVAKGANEQTKGIAYSHEQ